LYHVNDNITAGAFTDDIDDQGTFSSNLATINTANNYEYDGEGRLVRDSIEEIDTIKWTVTGKVKTVQRTAGSSKKNLKFDYDAMGQRIAKHVYDDTWTWEKSTYYVRDPQGNVMAVYDQEVQSSTMSYKVKERDIYGSSRVGMYTDTVEMIGAVLDTTYSNHVMGARTYELSNHLGNVLATISDKVIPKDWNSDATIDNFHADLVSSTDYYAFGCAMKGRVFEKASYRYHFNGMEKDDEMKGSGSSYVTEYRLYDPRIGKWLTPDPLEYKLPEISTYCSMNNNPLWYTDVKGLKADVTSLDEDEREQLRLDMEAKTGFTYKTVTLEDGSVMLQIDNTQKVKRDVDGKKMGSRHARAIARKLDRSSTTFYFVSDNSLEGNGQVNSEDPHTIRLNFQNIDSQEFRNGLNPGTNSVAMVVFHELFHTDLFGNPMSDPPMVDRKTGKKLYENRSKGSAIDKHTNRIRRQLGADYGQRMHYFARGGSGKPEANNKNYSYIAYDEESLKALKLGRNPTKGYYIARPADASKKKENDGN
jgi:RHS repeat-associated protein